MMATPCIVTNGDFSIALDSVVGGTPFIAQPAQVSGVYQFTESFVDTAYVFIDFWNATSGLHHMYVDTLLDNSTWTPWSMDLTFTEAPDSMLMYFWGGKNLGSTLLVDAITFTGGDLSMDQQLDERAFEVYPNPANDMINIRVERAELIRVFDMAGNLVYIQSELNNAGIVEISTKNLRMVCIYKLFMKEKYKVSN
ncbi:MAG: T9SS type A sorting domain-containing protein [Crocinitomicaceae bacterium]|nr:T9SS type A sorting domain-containing protein [Crocinitomicaceae bacterium]